MSAKSNHRRRMEWCTVAAVGLILIAGCGKDESTGPDPFSPTIAGTVRDASDSTIIEDANVILYDANTNEPVTRDLTDDKGYFSFLIENGNFYLKVAAQGYYPSPPSDGAPVPFQSETDDTTWQIVFLDSDPSVSSYGSFSGTVETGAGTGVSGVMVVATSAEDVFSGSSGPDGYYVFYNMPPGTYEVECHIAGHMQESGTVTAEVQAESHVSDINAAMSIGTCGIVSGQVSFVATDNPDSSVDVTLIHPEAREAVPGLATSIAATGGGYTISSIPYDTYIVWASYRNDGYVMDPDAIHKFGRPIVTLSEDSPDTTVSFKVTGAIRILSPTNEPNSLYPVEITTTRPTFIWPKASAYASTKEYIVEVFNARGEVIWGGFDAEGVIRHPKIEPGSSPISVEFDFDGSATDSLRVGETYRWKLYADNSADPNVQTLLSASEDLMGLFKVVVDTANTSG